MNIKLEHKNSSHQISFWNHQFMYLKKNIFERSHHHDQSNYFMINQREINLFTDACMMMLMDQKKKTNNNDLNCSFFISHLF